MNDEIWKPIDGFEGLYEVSNLARVRAVGKYVRGGNNVRYIPPHIKQQSINPYGYYYVILYKNNISKTCMVHILVAKAFIPNPENKPCIDHINTIRTDNRIENLRWVTHHENTQNPLTLKHIKDACTPEEIERQKQVKIANGTYNGRRVFQYTKEGVFVAEFDTVFAASESCGIPDSNICRALDNPTKSVGGFLWMTQKDENVKWKRNIHHGKRPIQQIDVDGVVIKEWNTIKEACQELGINRHGLNYSLMYGNGKCKNMQFRYKDSPR